MRLSAAGYLRPEFDRPLTPEDDASAAAVCPAVTLSLAHEKTSPVHPEWGPIHQVRFGWANDAEVRFKGSSGGGLSALLIHLLEARQVDFVVHVAASTSDPLRNERRISRNRQEVLQGAGSRYAPAAPLEGMESLFASGQRFAFVGKPCDVAAMRGYVAARPALKPQLVAVLSFMCAGVPSMTGTHEVLKALGTDASDVVRFQYRGNGWPGHAKAVTRAGRELTMDYNRSWGEILGRHLQLRCKLCPDGTGEFADVVCADAWHGEGGYPDFTEREGRSLVVSRTATGEALVLSAFTAGALTLEATDASVIAGMQPYQATRKQVVLGRWLAVALRTGVVPSFRGLHLWQALRIGGFMPALRNTWGTFKRVRHSNAS
jgi:coenzyme F420 hydrogenase subunit beta